MSERIKEILRRVAEEVMEKLAFLLSFSEEDEEQLPDAEDLTLVSISFSGFMQGVLVMAVSNGMLPKLAGNMLGLDEDEEETTAEQQHDALKELVNVICGNLLPAIGEKQHVCHIDTPMIVARDTQACLEELSRENNDASPISAKFFLEEGICELFLVIGNQVNTICHPVGSSEQTEQQ